MLEMLLGCGLGLAQGARHAFEPDHLAAVSALATGRGQGVVRMAAAWGVGHALMLLAVGSSLCALRADMPAELANVFELTAALMLVALGVGAFTSGARRPPVAPSAAPFVLTHTHARSRAPAQLLRPLSMGLVHGVAGSGALAALTVSRCSSFSACMLFMLAYGLGALAAMCLLAWLARRPLAKLSGHRQASAATTRVAAALSVLVGFAWGVPIAARLWY